MHVYIVCSYCFSLQLGDDIVANRMMVNIENFVISYTSPLQNRLLNM